MSDSTFGQRYKKYQVVEKIRESENITSILLAPVNSDEVPPFKAGQYITIRIDDNTVRTYTVSSGPHERRHYRISVKREPSSGEGFQPGRASGYIHDDLEVGCLLDVMEPRGDFYLNHTGDGAVALISGGVGLTPMVSMLHALIEGNRHVAFIHACENGSVHALDGEVAELSQSREGIRKFYAYRNPTDADRSQQKYHLEGVLTAEVLRDLLPPHCECYLCGPPPFMKAVYEALRALGVPKERIHYEFFGPSTVLDSDDVTEANPRVTSTVVFKRSRKRLDWNGFEGSILEFAEANGVKPSYGCRAGICSSCECDLLAGEVSYLSEPLDPPPGDRILPCITVPSSDEIELDL
ncbi:2Fe-2S iron-sulfur cluster-binding protein [Paraburkholderia oxyphila]|uniref:2Fe-2S iron-sulfur cluster-binding protein n=1 Tax=Paraburkholderia oxyphila TaxID=614212 RepID=UPI000482AF1F|nr:2Fe-2S iron-sulfur cluster-binding protein [Paraburkholderia oxyphila]